MINENTVSIRFSSDPCNGCHEPIGERHNVVQGSSREEDNVVCSDCYNFLQLSTEEKTLYMEKARNEKQCFTCKLVKTENIRSLTYASGEIQHICLECIDRANPSAIEKWSLNQLEMRTKINN